MEEHIRHMRSAWKMAEKSGCVSRNVGAVIAIGPHTRVVGTNEMPFSSCKAEGICRCFDPNRQPGKDLDKVYAIHAEAQAIATAAYTGVSIRNGIMYVTDLPCNECAKLIISSGIKRVFYDRDYPGSKALWMFEKAGVECQQLSVTPISDTN